MSYSVQLVGTVTRRLGLDVDVGASAIADRRGVGEFVRNLFPGFAQRGDRGQDAGNFCGILPQTGLGDLTENENVQSRESLGDLAPDFHI